MSKELSKTAAQMSDQKRNDIEIPKGRCPRHGFYLYSCWQCDLSRLLWLQDEMFSGVLKRLKARKRVSR